MKIVDELQQKVDEALDSVEAIQGEDFRNLLAFVMGSSQTMRLMSLLAHKHEDDNVAEAAYKQVAGMLAKGSAMIADAYKIEDDKLQELMKWVETLDGHVHNALKEASKHDK